MDLTGDDVHMNKDIPVDEYDNYKEANSYYHFDGNQFVTIAKEVSLQGGIMFSYPGTSIGDIYSITSKYCFRDRMDAGKVMGLAPYGDPSVYRERLMHLEDGRVEIDHSLLSQLVKPARSHAEFKANFQYYADIANWVQREVERTILDILNHRHQMSPSENLAYAPGIAL